MTHELQCKDNNNFINNKDMNIKFDFSPCYTFAAIVIKFIAETDLWTAIAVQAITNFAGNWLAMWLYEVKFEKK